ncbi:hypothetical protein AO715_11615 [Xanthomonas sp. Mitacek01]|nr:hypothetical protein AO715_11615 [Xanthomonas sp. Mitacek01]
MTEKQPSNIYGRRLREARDSYGYKQAELGIAARLDESAVSPRISRYETGVIQPKLGMQQLLAQALALPLAYFYTEDDEEARQIIESCRSEKPAARLLEIQSMRKKSRRK